MISIPGHFVVVGLPWRPAVTPECLDLRHELRDHRH